MYVAPNWEKSSNTIMVEVEMGGVRVKALVDTGAEASCCSEEWYSRHQQQLGGVLDINTRVVGVGETPIPIKHWTVPTTVGPCQYPGLNVNSTHFTPTGGNIRNGCDGPVGGPCRRAEQDSRAHYPYHLC